MRRFSKKNRQGGSAIVEMAILSCCIALIVVASAKFFGGKAYASFRSAAHGIEASTERTTGTAPSNNPDTDLSTDPLPSLQACSVQWIGSNPVERLRNLVIKAAKVPCLQDYVYKTFWRNNSLKGFKKFLAGMAFEDRQIKIMYIEFLQRDVDG